MDGIAGTVTGGLVTGCTGLNFNNPVPFGFVVGISFSVADLNASANMLQFRVDF